MHNLLQRSGKSSAFLSSIAALLCAAGILTLSTPAHAVRPFVTDDAEIVGSQQLETETFVQFQKNHYEHSLMFGLGMTPWLELGLGFLQGVENKKYGIQGPMFHVKASLRDLPDNGWSMAAVLGGTAPLGYGSYEPHGATGFVYGVYTHSFNGGKLHMHANVGVSFEGREFDTIWAPTVAYGIQVHFVSILYGVVEVFYSDPFDPGFEFGTQLGLRLLVSEHVQIDTTFGTEVTLSGDVHPWGTIGLRLVTKAPKSERDRRRALELREELAAAQIAETDAEDSLDDAK